MRVEHLIDGRNVPGRDYFPTINPENQETLAEVARGGTEEVNAAVAAAKAAFPAWAAKPAADRARILRKLGELITRHVTDIS
ncbi:MAG: aldehyde dehydrogenase family protein, partial [Proteobacteria bacterium]|nr:aldehyde dehydrogenase family protein [Pseudomonadota bacterium]